MKYVLFIPVFDRINYLKITLNTLRESLRKRNDVKVVLYNFSENSIKDLPCIKELGGIDIIEKDLVNEYVGKSCLDSYRMVTENYNADYYIKIDSDTVIHPGIFTGIDYMIKKIPSLKVGSVFNTPSHKTRSNIGNGILSKHTVGGFGLILTKDMIKQLLTITAKKVSAWDWTLSHYVKDKDIPIYCTNASYVEHIGYTGVHSPKGRDVLPNNIARAQNFFS